MRKFLIGAAALGLTTAAHAADLPAVAPAPVMAANYIYGVNNQVSLDFTETYKSYAEYVPALFDTESGWAPGVSLSGAFMRNLIVDNLYVYGQLSFVDGNTRYVGAFQGGAFGSLVQSHKEELFDSDFRIGKGFGINSSFMLTPFVGVGSNYWRRNSTGLPGGYLEEYSNGYIGAGLLGQFVVAPAVVVSLDGLIGSTFGGHISASNIPIVGGTASFAAPLGSSAIYKAGLSVDYALTSNWHLNAGVDFTQFNYGRSPNVVVAGLGTVNEPNSHTYDVALKIGMGYSF